MLLVVSLGVFSWGRLSSMGDALDQIKNGRQMAITAADLGKEIAESSLHLGKFVESGQQSDGESTVDAMQDVLRNSRSLVAMGVGSASGMVDIKTRHIEELENFITIYENRRLLKDTITSFGIQNRRDIGRLGDKLEERGIDAGAFQALRASESFLVTRVRIDRFIGGMPLSELDTATPPYEATIESLAGLSDSSLTLDERTLLRGIQTGLSEFWSTVNSLREVEIQSRESMKIVANTTLDVYSQLDQVRSEINSTINELNERTQALVSETISSILFVVMFVVVFGSSIAALLSFNLSRRLRSIVAQTTDLANGNLSVDVTGTVGRGDLSAIAQALEKFKVSALERRRIEAERIEKDTEIAEGRDADLRRQTRVVRDLEEGLSRLERGEFVYSIDSPSNNPFPSEYDELRIAFNKLASNLSQIMGRIVGVAEQVRGGSDEITAAAQDLAGRAETQAATLEESAAALNELNESVRSTAELAQTAESATRENRKSAEQGAAIVEDAILAMRKIEESSEQINRIISVIDDIAFQTNLLALNAGVEAARAGEAGRGFAVVASEVRGLAQRASESAREIKALISESTQQVEVGSSLVTRSGNSLEQILLKAKEVSEQATSIAVAAIDQASALGEINSGINQLDQVTQQNAAVAEQTNAAAGSLQQQAATLLNELAGFVFDKDRIRASGIKTSVQSDLDVSTSGFDTGNVRSFAAGNGKARLVEF